MALLNETQLEMNVSENNVSTLLVQSRKLHEPVSVWLVTLVWCTATWTVVSNLILVTAILSIIRTSRELFLRVVLSFSLCDLVVGISYMPILVSESIKTISNYIGCSMSFVLYFAAQLASIYHVLGICIFRASTVKTLLVQRDSSEKRSAAIIPVCAWVSAFVVIIVCFVKWSNSSAMYLTLDQCTADVVLLDLKQAMPFIALNYIAPQLVTDVVYAYVCIRLHQTVNRVAPGGTSTQVVDPNSVATRNTSMAQTGDTNLRSNGMVNLRAHRRILGTIGIITLVFNLLTIPLVVYFIIGGTVEQNRDIGYGACAMFALNSAINPFVYAYRIASLRKAIRDMFVGLKQTCCS